MAGRSCNQVVDSTIHVSAEDQLNLSNTLTMCFHTMLSINAILCLFVFYLFTPVFMQLQSTAGAETA